MREVEGESKNTTILCIIRIDVEGRILTRPQSSSYNTRQRKSCARGREAGDDFSLPISPCAPFLGTHLSLRSSCALYEDDWGRVRVELGSS